MAADHHFFAFLARMKYIARWGVMRNTHTENIQEHSLQAAMIAHGLALIARHVYGRQVDAERVMALALYHEVSEVVTGDLPSPVKHRDPALRSAYGRIEEAAREHLFTMLPEPLRDAYRPLLFADADEAALALVKAADKLCAYLKCLEELAAGNAEFARARATIEAEIEALKLPEVGYFMEHFVPSFSLSLDELSR